VCCDQRIAATEGSRSGFPGHFAHELRLKETQDEILNLLLDAAGGFAPRVALFAAREDSFSVGLREVSRSQGSGDFTVVLREIGEPLPPESLLADVPKSTGHRSADPKLAQLLDSESGTPWHASRCAPFRRPVAVLLQLRPRGAPAISKPSAFCWT